ncbi:TonB-dependent receptor [Pseudoblastomonas halimionae]|uniref:TonB-dependent receptor n=1 Tax=Alteriqipengyuania halimionae TaxID=1926630 RepID=A0A6I4U2M2_9SPHN|nr:TonB-dependent receptor [Alteriqipengyuania halimionae]MXP10319.1 TonB-dependent receptor [Alteriqipengyuania halimionae]
MVTTFTSRGTRSRRCAILATASSLALAAVAQPAYAQDTQDEDGDAAEQETPAGTPESVENKVVITGFRQSLENAQDIKRNADTVVDVISAEDIGALADRSVAEALQRVPGVNISRFASPDDPDRFSVEGSGVIIRGLSFVRSELNGRDIFSADGGRTLSFNDVSPELLGRVEVYKNTTADMIDGGISGTVNLVTRKPLDNPGFNIAGTLEYNYGDLAEEWSPGFSVLASDTFDVGIGTFGLQLGYAQQELKTRTDASQLTDPCYRPADLLSGGCIRARDVGDGGFGGSNFDETNFPPAGSVVVPKGAGVRTTSLERDRNAYSVVGQFESNDGRVQITAEYLRADTDTSLEEFSMLALVNNDAFFPIPQAGTDFTFDSEGFFERGTLTQTSDGGIPGISTENLHFQQEGRATTEDYSVSIQIEPTDRLAINFEGQVINSKLNTAGVIFAMQTYSDIFIDNSGDTPQVQFFQPGTQASPADYFTDPALTYFWFHLDNQIDNEGSLYSMRGDIEYDISDTGFFRKARFGARWADRSRVTRNANYSNWSNLGAPWTGRNGNWNGDDPQAYGAGGAYAFDFPDQAAVYNPFGDNFQRGNAPVPAGNGAAIFYGGGPGDNLVEAYLNGQLSEDVQAIKDFTLTSEGRPLIGGRTQQRPDGTLVQCDPFCPTEVVPVDETTNAAYARVDFGHDFDSGLEFSGNIGVRYVETRVRSSGLVGFLGANYIDDPVLEDPADPTSPNRGGDGDGVAEISDIQNRCDNVPAGEQGPGFCQLSAARQAEFAAGLTGDVYLDRSDETYDHWLPSFNARLNLNNGIVLRAAVSKGIFRPDLSAFRTGGLVFDNTNNLVQGGTTDTGALFGLNTGNRSLRPVESWNYDISAEWYFDDVGSLTVALFAKDISNQEVSGATVQELTSPQGNAIDVLINGPVNSDSSTLKGAELAFQDTFDFLPGALAGFGTQLTYTYVDGGAFNNNNIGAERSPFANNLPLTGISEHTVNAVLFYEMYGFSARAAYNWRSEYLLTTRDVIFPFQPIFNEATGQLDASIFYDVTDQIKVGVQGVNLLDEVTRTSQVFDFDQTRVVRSAFRNDRRFTFLVRFDF